MDAVPLDSPRLDVPNTPPRLDHSSLPAQDSLPPLEVSKIEAADVTGVTFSPELWMQRRFWALEVMRREGVRSVLDMGCGPGALLETLVIPPTTIREPPILSSESSSAPPKAAQPPSPADSDRQEDDSRRELFITRLGALDASENVIPSALAILAPPSQDPSSSSSSSFPPRRPRWEPMTADLWLGAIEKYNPHMEGYECMTALELIEHLDPNVLSRFGVVTMGTYRPRLLLVTTPNFDFNAKFPRADDHDHGFAQKGFIDPTGRTERVFRHSDHKLEMTAAEFRDWAEGAAADWGYDVQISGVGISNKPSYYPADDPHFPNRPIYASQTAIFRLASGIPTRSPRSVRSSELPFLSKESSRPHKLAAKFTYPARHPGYSSRASPSAIRDTVRQRFQEWNIGEVSLEELWAREDVCGACTGSKRYLIGCLGGWGNVEAADSEGRGEFEVKKEAGSGLTVRWSGTTGA